MTKQTVIYDLEIYKNCFLGCFYNIDTQEMKTYRLGQALLDDIILNPDVTLIGYNNDFYDDLLLKYIAKGKKGKASMFSNKIQEVTEYDLYLLSARIIELGRDDTEVRNLSFEPTVFNSIDLKALLDPLPSLKKLEVIMRYNNVQDLPIDPHEEVPDELLEQLETYCKNDVMATHYLYDKYAKPHIDLRYYLQEKFELDEPLTSLSEARTAEKILSTVYCRAARTTPWQIRNSRNDLTKVHLANCIPGWVEFQTEELRALLQELRGEVLPLKDSGHVNGQVITRLVTIAGRDYQMGVGGLHSVDKANTFHPTDNGYRLIDADVTSYYPSILLRDKLYPRRYEHHWTSFYRQIYDDRVAEKAAGNKLQADALKIVLNATFGKFGSKYSTFYDPELMTRVTLTGQLGLLMLIEQVTLAGLEVISANTDGILVKIDDEGDYALFGHVCDEWEQVTKFNLEYTEYERFCQRDVNNYTALTVDGSIKNKGIFAPEIDRGKPIHFVKAPIVQKTARDWLLFDKPIEFTDDIYDYLFSFSGTRAFTVYLDENAIQKTNRWYRSTSKENLLRKFGGKNQTWIKIPDGQNVKIVNKVTETSLPDDLDFNYYNEKIIKLIEDSGGIYTT